MAQRRWHKATCSHGLPWYREDCLDCRDEQVMAIRFAIRRTSSTANVVSQCDGDEAVLSPDDAWALT